MARLQLPTTGLLTTLALSFCLVVAEDSGLVAMVPEIQDSADAVRKESHVVLTRQKREWIWNSLYVEEEKPAPRPYKIGQVRFKPSILTYYFKCIVLRQWMFK